MTPPWRLIKRKLLLPFRLVWWTLTLQLPDRLKLRAKGKFLLQSGLFDPVFYLDHNPDVAQASVDPVEHYLTSGASAGRQPHALFDPVWYLAQNPDLGADVNPLMHYLEVGWKEGRTPHRLFDSQFYLERNPDVARAGVEPLAQYLRFGGFEGRDPHPLFDSDFYLAQNPQVAAARVNPLAHYLTRGWRELRNPHPFFDVGFYLNRYADVAQGGSEPLQHYLASATTETRDPHPAFDTHFYIGQHPEVRASGSNPLLHFLQNTGADPNQYFLVAYYLEQNSEVPRNSAAAVGHYLLKGAADGRNPHPCFDTKWYLEKNPEVARSGENPLLHFLQRGRREGRDPHPLFDSKFYIEKNEDLAGADVPPPDHYFHSGGQEGRDPHPLFDSDWYLALTPEAANSGENPLTHYLRRGWKERRSPCAVFDGAFYLEQNPDVADGPISPLQHYLLYGAAEGRDPSRWFDTDWYLAQNSEIIAAGWNPLVHYVRIGVREGRRPRPLTTPSKDVISRNGRPRIVFISGEPHIPGHQYRVANIASSLAPKFFETVIINSSDVPQRMDELSSADLVWIWRTRLLPETAMLVRAARDAGAKILFDVDDLMFRPELANEELIDGIRSQNISQAEVQKFYKAIQLLLLDADRCTAPTIPLATEIKDLHRSVTVIPNGFDRQARERSRIAMREHRSKPEDGLIRIGYAAGTRTHQRDLAVASGALRAVLSENSNARLVVFRGAIALEEFPDLQAVQDQIEWRDLVALEKLPSEYARFDINIAPVEVGNRYCEAKSELKFFEAALAGVPTIASPTRPFADAIRNGDTGFLAATSDQWHESLTRLLHDPGLRRHMADRAYQDCLWLYGPERRSLLVTRLIQELLAPAPLRFELFRAQMQIENAATMPAIAVPKYEVLFQSERRANSRVSVVVPLFNYAHLLEEALESVRQQTMRDIDVIVADDQSSDNSAATAHRWLEQHAAEFNQVTLLQNVRNSKLGRTRNAAVSFSDTELYMALDPDNALHPDCLEKCMATLDETGAAFAYPTIDLFGDRTGQIGTREYDPAILPCTNYIDAMAMVRKACWIAVGGYSALDPMGWEDYEFWCKMAEKGLFGARVPETTARYRTHDTSMLRTLTDVPKHKRRAVEELNRRHSWLQLRVSNSIEEPVSTSPVPVAAAAESSSAPTADAAKLDGLLRILRCPETREHLKFGEHGTLVSQITRRSWPIVMGRPVFTAEGRNITIQPETHVSNELPQEALDLIEQSPGLVLNLSAGGTIMRFPNVIELEYTIFKHTDLAADVHNLPFDDEVFDGVVCLNALEHYRDPETAIEQMRRVLKPGGWVFFHTAFLQPLHEAPHHYYNCTEFGLRQWMRRFEVESLRVSPKFNPVYTLSWLASDAEYAFAEGISREAAAVVADARVAELAQFWRNPASRNSSELWDLFYQLPAAIQHRLAAGWEAIGRKI